LVGRSFFTDKVSINLQRKPKASASQEEVKRYSVDKYLKKKFVKDLAIPDPLTAFKKGILVPTENTEKKV
jgi:hypothetical protein